MAVSAVTLIRGKSAFDLSDIQVAPPATRNGLKNFRCKRDDSIPGWFDRWDFFEDTIKHPESIASSITDATHQSACRRRVIRGIAIHLSVVTGLVCVLVLVCPIADALRQTPLGNYQGHGERLGLAAGLVLELLALKLVFDIPVVRSLVFALYTITVALLFASTTLAFDGAYAVACLALVAGDWWLRWRLCGARTRGVFLHPALVTVISLALVGGVLASLLATASKGNAQLTLGLGLAFEIINAILGTIEVFRLLDSLPVQEAADSVYFLNLDLLAGGVFMPLMLTCYLLATILIAILRCLWRVLVWLSWIPWCIWQCMDASTSLAVAMAL